MTFMSRRPREVYRVYGEEELEQHGEWPADPQTQSIDGVPSETAAATTTRSGRGQRSQARLRRTRGLQMFGILTGGGVLGVLVGIVVLADLSGHPGRPQMAGAIPGGDVAIGPSMADGARHQPAISTHVLLDGPRPRGAITPSSRMRSVTPRRSSAGHAEASPAAVRSGLAGVGRRPRSAGLPVAGPADIAQSKPDQAAATVEFDFER
jgi:hypothetical protein